MFLVPIGLALDDRVRKIILPTFGFVLLFSILPHKELRFIIYAFPFFNVAAATTCHRMYSPLNFLLTNIQFVVFQMGKSQ